MELIKVESLKLGVRDIINFVILIALIFALLMVLTWTGYLKCSVIPGWCTVQDAIFGKPTVLIVYGDDGLGDPIKLRWALAQPEHLGVHAQLQQIGFLSVGNLKDYRVIIVEKCATMSTEHMKAFMEYANVYGGRLIWVGDSGTKLTDKDLMLLKIERSGGIVDEKTKNETIGPWARKTDKGEVVSLDNFLGVSYVGNYCQLKDCNTNSNPFIGNMTKTAKDHPLVYGIGEQLPYRGDIALVEDLRLGTRVLSINYGSILRGTIGDKKIELPKEIPVIVESGVGGKVAYYAVPPEQFVNEDAKMSYWGLIENMYLGILGRI